MAMWHISAFSASAHYDFMIIADGEEKLYAVMWS